MLLAAGSCFDLAEIRGAERTVISLNGDWQIEDSISAGDIPASWTHTAPVPGLANLARPAFPDVDAFDSKEVLWNRFRKGKVPESALVDGPGVPHQNRNYFWYQKTFRVPAQRQTAILKINKAQFGAAVWLNGKTIGEHLPCFTAAYFDVTNALKWAQENTLTIRIGAHPAVLPVDFPAGTDFEKNRWTPGIYDEVSLLLSDNPVIQTIQVAPRIQGPEIQVQTAIKNFGTKPVSFELRHRVHAWKDNRQVASSPAKRIQLKPGEETTVTQTIPLPSAQLWTPEHPFLYVLESSTGGDTAATRFGIREFRYDTATRRAFLNGKVYFLRGSNITLHRFFEDPLAGSLTWNETWVRKLLTDIPKRMNWNAFRFCIGPAPDKWLDIADETGLLIQNEYFIWTGSPPKNGKYGRHWNADELIRQYKEWMRDNWNHPSMAVWDANNESYDPVFAEKVIPAVRSLDLSNRPWENSYNPPAGPDDPVEDHPYLFSRGAFADGKPFQMTELERMSGSGKSTVTPTGHAQLLNEYGWLWLLRDGTPTELTPRVYESLLGPNATGPERLALYGYLLGGLTEFWRAHRNHAGVLHFVYLTSCYPGAYTCDNFEDVQNLKLEPHFADYVREAFKPLGVYLNFWQPTIKAEERRRFVVMMVNDDSESARGKMVLSLESDAGKEVARTETGFHLAGLGQQTLDLEFQMPRVEGKFVLKAAAYKDGNSEPTISRRNLRVEGASTPAGSL